MLRPQSLFTCSCTLFFKVTIFNASDVSLARIDSFRPDCCPNLLILVTLEVVSFQYFLYKYHKNSWSYSYCSLRRMQSHAHLQALMQVYVCNLLHVRNHSIFTFVLLLLYISCKEKFFIEGFFIEHYINTVFSL